MAASAMAKTEEPGNSAKCIVDWDDLDWGSLDAFFNIFSRKGSNKFHSDAILSLLRTASCGQRGKHTD